MAHAVRAFQSDDAVGRLKEAEFLLCQRVRRMVGGQQIHGAVGDGRDGGFAVRFGAQWRIHLGERAVLEQRLVAQRQIVRRGLAGNRQSFGLGPANRLERDGSAHMLEVHVDTGAAAASISRATILSSVSSGMPGTPSSRETGPSFTAPVS